MAQKVKVRPYPPFAHKNKCQCGHKARFETLDGKRFYCVECLPKNYTLVIE